MRHGFDTLHHGGSGNSGSGVFVAGHDLRQDRVSCRLSGDASIAGDVSLQPLPLCETHSSSTRPAGKGLPISERGNNRHQQ